MKNRIFLVYGGQVVFLMCFLFIGVPAATDYVPFGLAMFLFIIVTVFSSIIVNAIVLNSKCLRCGSHVIVGFNSYRIPVVPEKCSKCDNEL